MGRASYRKRSIPFIPFEIISLILVRVPARSLLRLRCVCKDWCNLIDSFSFVRNQVSIASQQPHVVLAPNNFPLSYKSFTFNGNVLKESSRFPILENNKCLDYIHAGEVGFGFTCFQYRYRPGEAFLFNPLRRQVLVLPMATCIGQPHWYGMGIDSTINEYKIVHFVSSVDTDSLAAEIYTLGTKSPWRQIPSISPFPFHSLSIDHITGVSAHGDMHWTDQCKIISFDFEKEEFKLTPHPDLGYNPVKSFLLTTLRGSLAVLSFSKTQAEIWDSEIQAEIWVMKDYEKKIWVKEYKISMNTDHPKFWDYDCNVGAFNSHWIFVDGIEHDHKFLLDLYETTRYPRRCTIFNHTESLISLQHFGTKVTNFRNLSFLKNRCSVYVCPQMKKRKIRENFFFLFFFFMFFFLLLNGTSVPIHAY